MPDIEYVPSIETALEFNVDGVCSAQPFADWLYNPVSGLLGVVRFPMPERSLLQAAIRELYLD